ncbi:MAG TPA: hypothetical protein VE570_06705 [Thermoleophilaceae bacterium]|jgi:hypothetical protein|nr:hypothetical protein [Thermoleophilaceae bacterium]
MRIRTGVVLGSLSAAAAAAALAASGSAASGVGATTFKLDFEPSHAHFIDAAPRRGMNHPTPGDLLIGASRVFDQSGKTVLGHTSEICTITTAGSHMTCGLDVTMELARGMLVVSGAADPTHTPWRAAVVGGTGAYAGARGTMTVTDARGGAAEYWRYDPA